MRKKYPNKAKKTYPEKAIIYKGKEKLTLLVILANGRRLYTGFLQIYVIG